MAFTHTFGLPQLESLVEQGPRGIQHWNTQRPASEMREDHSVLASTEVRPVFLKARSGDVVIVWEHPELAGTDCGEWWMAEILVSEGSPRHPAALSHFQVIDVDTGTIRWVNADCVQQILLPVDKLVISSIV